MKKAYSKPLVYAEQFELLEHISAMCSGYNPASPRADQINSNNEWICGFLVRDGYLFNNNQCTVSDGEIGQTDQSKYDIYCYNSPLNQPGSPFGAS